MQYKRVILKLSGELFRGKGDLPVDLTKVDALAKELVVASKEMQIGVVFGGGNIWRGRNDAGKTIGETTGHYMGIMATFVNALALKGALERNGTKAHIVAPFFVPGVTTGRDRSRPIPTKRQMDTWLKRGDIIVFAAGTGKPGPSTDAVTVTRAREIGADVVLKGTKVDGVYTRDPEKYKSARRYDELSYNEYISKKLGVMDVRAVRDAKKNKLPIVVFKWKKGALRNVRGTVIS